ncbi:MAG: DUF819 family protein, partial [Thiovulaceae bacterium]|nr:DUF819 family protein [Sulfurimonadaceae bacterium]
KIPFLKKIGPVLLLYLIGIIVGNSGLINNSSFKIQDLMVTIIIPLAIPLMLFSSNFREWNIKSALLTLLTGVISVIITVVAGFFIFKPLIGNDPLIGGNLYKIAGMLTGVYTGGTPNLAALKLMLNVPHEPYIMVHSYDMAISLLYLTFLLSFGIKLFRKFLNSKNADSHIDKNLEEEENNQWNEIFYKKNFYPLLAAIGLSILIFILSGGISLLINSKYQMIVVILAITSFGIAASFYGPVRKIKKSYDAGMYLVYIFSIVVASMANLSKLNLEGGFYLLLYIAFAVFGSLFLQIIFSKIFKLDADTVVVSSVALINSPPFVPLIASAMHNKSVIITGITVGLVGYAAGNYLGFIIAELLKVFQI